MYVYIYIFIGLSITHAYYVSANDWQLLNRADPTEFFSRDPSELSSTHLPKCYNYNNLHDEMPWKQNT